jgi:hypothetical protein
LKTLAAPVFFFIQLFSPQVSFLARPGSSIRKICWSGWLGANGDRSDRQYADVVVVLTGNVLKDRGATGRVASRRHVLRMRASRLSSVEPNFRAPFDAVVISPLNREKGDSMGLLCNRGLWNPSRAGPRPVPEFREYVTARMVWHQLFLDSFCNSGLFVSDHRKP